MGGGGILGMASSFHKTFLSIIVHYSLESRLALYSVVVEAPLQPQCRRDILLIFVIVSENSTDSSFRFKFVGFDLI